MTTIIFSKIRNVAKAFLPFYLLALLTVVTSCKDMLETDSDLQLVDPALDQKTDSIYFTLGILKGVQQAIDQYVLINEMRGDLTQVNQFTSADLRELANFSATTENKYDSAYVFYRIINNCNYFIAHRDTTLLTGSRKVAMPEYVQAHSIRAWAYLQLAKIYGEVPFFTEPITNISEINSIRDRKDVRGICEALAPGLRQYADSTALAAVPTYGTGVRIGYMNNGREKNIDTRMTMFPVGLVLADLYLEAGDYANAATQYFKYLRDNRLDVVSYVILPVFEPAILRNLPPDISYRLPYGLNETWDNIFSMNYPSDVITYVPMAVNKLQGQTTDLPRLFGYDYYATDANSYRDLYLVEREIDPSQTYFDLSAAQEYYYVPASEISDANVKTAPIGDLRRYETLEHISKDDSLFYEMTKFESGNIYIYRTTTAYLRLAEALNRMGYPDAAFAILKDGFNSDLATDSTYLQPETHTLLRTTIPFFSTENIETFANSVGIHGRGCGYTRGNYTPYQYDAIVDKKIGELKEIYGAAFSPTQIEWTVDTVDSEGNPYSYTITEWSKEDLINAVEDLICDEYALEFAFEGNRFGDLCRLARHKNEAATYGSNFGSIWLARKLAYKNPVVDLTEQRNWYLPLGK